MVAQILRASCRVSVKKTRTVKRGGGLVKQGMNVNTNIINAFASGLPKDTRDGHTHAQTKFVFKFPVAVSDKIRTSALRSERDKSGSHIRKSSTPEKVQDGRFSRSLVQNTCALCHKDIRDGSWSAQRERVSILSELWPTDVELKASAKTCVLEDVD